MSWMVLGILGAVTALAVPVVVIVLVVRAGRHGRGPAAAPGAPVRRFFQYGLMYAALLMVAIGLSLLGRAAFEAEGMIGRGATRVATPLSLLIVGGPLFVVLAVWTRRRMEEDPGERLSVGWLLYATAALITALVVTMVSAIDAVSAALGVRGASGTAWVTAVVWGAVWAGHWVATLRRVPPDESRSHRLLGSLVGLFAALGSVIALGAVVATWAYDELFSRNLLSTIGHDLRSLAGPVVVSLAVWWWYWVRTARRQAPTVGWNAYVLLGGVLGGLLIAVVSAGVALFTVLGWLLGEAGPAGAAAHFSVLPGVAVAALLGAGTWRYHRDVLRRAGVPAADEVARTYSYLLSAVGLVAAAAGLTALVVALIEVASRPRGIVFVGGTRGVALWGLTLLAVGLPLWWTAWTSVHDSGRDPVEERTSLSRRLYLSGSFGLGGIVAVVSLLGVAAVFFEDLIGGSIGRGTLHETRVSLALVITVGAIAAYHWRVFRADRALGPSRGRAFERLVLVAPGDAASLATALAERTGARVEVWQSASDGGSVSDEAIVEALTSLSGPDGIVIVDAGGVRVVDARRLS